MSIVAIVLAGALVLGTLGGGLTYFLVIRGQDAQAAEDPVRNQTGPVYSVPEITTNLVSGQRNHFIQVKIELEVDDREGLKELEDLAIPVRDKIIGILRSKVWEDVTGETGMRQLGQEIREQVNHLLVTGQVTGIYFTKFIVQ